MAQVNVPDGMDVGHESRLSGSSDFTLPISDLILQLQSTAENNHHNSRPHSFNQHPSSVAVPIVMRSRRDLGSDVSVVTLV
ncbi:hypothetical protein LXL04_033468 [Taraxacum kok-saghyz]